MDAPTVIKTLAALEGRTEDFTDKAALLAAIRVLKYLHQRDLKKSPNAASYLTHLVIEP